MNNYIDGLSGEEDVLANSEFNELEASKTEGLIALNEGLTAEELDAIDRSEGDFRQDEESDNELSGM